jgi:uncharacterized membrane protein YgdD (TMEM256/DUF423 family)
MTASLRSRLLLLAAGTNGAMAVMAAAYGAHGLDGHATELIEKGSNFQLLHATLLVALVPGQGRWQTAAAVLFVLGMILFCGSLYVMVIWSVPTTALVPLGGSAFIFGWLMLVIAALRGDR